MPVVAPIVGAISAAAPVISTIGTIAGAVQGVSGLFGGGRSQASQINPMDSATAVEQSKLMYNPIFKDSLDTTVKNIGNDLKTRGMFGQLSGADKIMKAASDNEGRRISAITQNANQLMNNSQNAAINSANLALREKEYNDKQLAGLNDPYSTWPDFKWPWEKKSSTDTEPYSAAPKLSWYHLDDNSDILSKL